MKYLLVRRLHGMHIWRHVTSMRRETVFQFVLVPLHWVHVTMQVVSHGLGLSWRFFFSQPLTSRYIPETLL